jgi:hypothetical protein
MAEVMAGRLEAQSILSPERRPAYRLHLPNRYSKRLDWLAPGRSNGLKNKPVIYIGLLLFSSGVFDD